MRFTGFIGPSYVLRSVNVDCQRCINMYPEMHELGNGKSREVAALLSTPGLTLLTTLGDGPIRGLFTASNGRVFAVSEDTLYELSSSWVGTSRGTLNSTSGPVSIADNGISLCVVDGADGYVLTFADNTFAEITDVDFVAFGGADQVTYQDGYFIFNSPDTGQFFISELNGVDFDALDFATSEGSPDDVVAIISDHRDLWVFNDKTIEVFFNSGNADFPFERVQGAFVEHGCAAPFSISKMNNTVFWLSQDDKGAGMVMMAEGYNPQRISTHAVEKAIQSYTMSSATAYSYQQDGHYFYALNFDDADTTWVFDTTTGMWHERTYNNDGILERHRANSHAFAFGSHIVGDYENGKIFQLDTEVYTDNGAAITRQRVAPHITTTRLKRLFYSAFQLDLETGTGLDGTGQGTDPQIMLEFSDDGGHTWSNEKWTDMGAIGERLTRAIWRRLGASRDRVFKVTITDPVPVTMIGAELDVEEAAS